MNKFSGTTSCAAFYRRFKGAIINLCQPFPVIIGENNILVFNVEGKVGVTINRVHSIKSFIWILGGGCYNSFLLDTASKNATDIV